MKCISLWQPWASLWLTDRKRHETRHYATAHRGLLYVHAAKRPIRESDLSPRLRAICEEEFVGHFWKELPFGAVIGIVNIADCIRTEDVNPIEADDMECGDFSPGRYAWRRSLNPTHIAPWPYKGLQSMWDIRDLGQVANRVLGIKEP